MIVPMGNAVFNTDTHFQHLFVIPKVEPKAVEYWHDELQPWVHYLPVQGNMTDLMEKIEYAVDPANDSEMRKMVQAANDWCFSKMTVTQIAVDMLWMLLSYLDLLAEVSAVTQPEPTTLHEWLSQWTNLTETHRFIPASQEPLFGSDDKSIPLSIS